MNTEVASIKEKSFHIKTFGCQMNYHDTERMSALLVEQGYSPTEDIHGAELVLFNSCSIREKAQNKASSNLGIFKAAKQKNPKLKLGYAGCVAQHEGKNVFKQAPYLDFVMGTDSIDLLPEILYRLDHGEKQVLAVDWDPSQDYSIATKVMPGKRTAFVNIMKGCDNFCTYCIVPFTRGREKSRKIDEVVADVEQLLRKGIVEVTLLGQNVNSYGKSLGGVKAGQTFSKLLRAIEAMADRLDQEGVTDPKGLDAKPQGLLRLRYTTSHPKDFGEDMIECHRDLKRLVPHLHLPVQSGSGKVLRKMKRYLPIETYIERVKQLREVVSGIVLTTDMITGFPGETEEDFQATMDLIETVRFEGIYAYTYSPRPGTAAIDFGDTVPDEVKSERLLKLQHRQAQIQAEVNRDYKDRVVEVLVEGASKTNPNMLMGRTPGWKVVHFPKPTGESLYGKFAQVKISATTAFSLMGELRA